MTRCPLPRRSKRRINATGEPSLSMSRATAALMPACFGQRQAENLTVHFGRKPPA